MTLYLKRDTMTYDELLEYVNNTPKQELDWVLIDKTIMLWEKD